MSIFALRCVRRWPPRNDTLPGTSYLAGVELGDDGNPTGPLGPTVVFQAANTTFEQDVEVSERTRALYPLPSTVATRGLLSVWPDRPGSFPCSNN